MLQDHSTQLGNKKLIVPITFFLISILSIFFSIFDWMITPLGNEPDFHIRFDEYLIFMNENLFNLNIFGLKNGVFDNPRGFYQSEHILLKSIFIVSFILFTYLFLLYLKSKVVYKLVIICLLFPNYLYFVSLFSIESIWFFISSFFIGALILKKYLICLIILPTLFVLDRGNSLIILMFLTILISFKFFSFGFKVFIFTTLISFIIFEYNLEILKFLSSFSEKKGILQVLYDKSLYEIEDVGSKYPVFIRWVIVFFSLYDLRPFTNYNIFTISSLVWILISYIFINKINLEKHFKDLFFSALSTIILITSLLPAYSFAKYYVPLLPILLLPTMYFWGLKINIVFFLIIISLRSIMLLF